MAYVGAVVGAGLWAYFAVEPTIGSALIAAIASIVNTVLIVRHERRVNQRFDERRIVSTRTEDGVYISDEERRELEDRRAKPEKRKLRERRRWKRRNGRT